MWRYNFWRSRNRGGLYRKATKTGHEIREFFYGVWEKLSVCVDIADCHAPRDPIAAQVSGIVLAGEKSPQANRARMGRAVIATN